MIETNFLWLVLKILSSITPIRKLLNKLSIITLQVLLNSIIFSIKFKVFLMEYSLCYL